MSETVFEVPVNPTGGNHSTDDKTSKTADNNQPSPDKEDNNSSDDYQVEVPVKLSTEGSVGDRRQVSQATEIATTVPEAIVSIGPSIPVNAIEEKVVTDTETPKSAKSDETSKDNHIKVAVNCQSWQLSLRLLVARHFLAMV